MSAPDDAPVLACDVGGTNLRLALWRHGGHGGVATVAADDHADLATAIRAGLEKLEAGPSVSAASLALAGPVLGDAFAFTNRPAWSFSALALADDLDLDRVTLVNDLTAVALALPGLGDGDWRALGAESSEAPDDAPQAVVAPGTGLGVSGLVPCPGGGLAALAGEGGHGGLAAVDPRCDRVIAHLAAARLRASPDRVLSGQGLRHIYAALADLPPDAAPSSAEITARAATDPLAAETIDLFALWLGAFTGDVALTLGARGGAWIAGGVVPALGARFDVARFRRAFEDKGRFAGYMAAIPTRLVTAGDAAIRGAAAAFGRTGPGVHTLSRGG